MRTFFIFLFLFTLNCSSNKVTNNHGFISLNEKFKKITINKTNKNDIIKIIGPPSTTSKFENDVFIYIERKTTSSKLIKLRKKTLLINNVLILDINNKGILIAKKFYNKEDMKNIKMVKSTTESGFRRNTFVYNFMSSMRQKINDPLGQRAKQRKKINQR